MSYHSGFKYIDGTDGQGETFILPDDLEVKNLTLEENLEAVNGDFSGIVEAKELKSNELDTIGNNDMIIKRNNVDGITLRTNDVRIERPFSVRNPNNPSINQITIERVDGNFGGTFSCLNMTGFTALSADNPTVNDVQILSSAVIHLRSNTSQRVILHNGATSQANLVIYGSTGSVNRRDIALQTNATRGGEMLLNCLSSSPGNATYGFLNNAGLGMYRSALNTLAFSCNSVEQMSIATNGVSVFNQPYLHLTDNLGEGMASGFLLTLSSFTEVLKRNIDHASGIITITSPGVYQINYTVSWKSGPAGVRFSFISINNTDIRYGVDYANLAGTEIHKASGSCCLNLAVNDTIRIKVQQNSGSFGTVGGFPADENTVVTVTKLH
jgi:hypothetical protein